jgi:hypothetical protein
MAEMSGTAVALTRLSLRRVFAGRRRRAGRRRGRRADETLLEVPEATAALHVHRDRGVKRDGRRASCRDCDRAATRTQKGPAKGVRSEEGEVARPPAFSGGAPGRGRRRAPAKGSTPRGAGADAAPPTPPRSEPGPRLAGGRRESAFHHLVMRRPNSKKAPLRRGVSALRAQVVPGRLGVRSVVEPREADNDHEAG